MGSISWSFTVFLPGVICLLVNYYSHMGLVGPDTSQARYNRSLGLTLFRGILTPNLHPVAQRGIWGRWLKARDGLWCIALLFLSYVYHWAKRANTLLQSITSLWIHGTWSWGIVEAGSSSWHGNILDIMSQVNPWSPYAYQHYNGKLGPCVGIFMNQESWIYWWSECLSWCSKVY